MKNAKFIAILAASVFCVGMMTLTAMLHIKGSREKNVSAVEQIDRNFRILHD